MTLHSEQFAAACARFNLTSDELASVYSTDGDSPEVKKWKDLFAMAVALWLDCEMTRPVVPPAS